jgi:hypothetical protein
MPVLPIEILEHIARYLDGKSLFNLLKVEPAIKSVVINSDFWIVRFPPAIDWTSPDAPKKYKEYEKADFTIEFKGKIYRRSDGFWFNLKPNNLALTRTGKQPDKENLTLEIKNMVIGSSPMYTKFLNLGKSQEEMDRDFVIRSLKIWPDTLPRKPGIPIGLSHRRYEDFEDEYFPEKRRSRKKKPEKVYYDEDGDFSLTEDCLTGIYPC